MTVEPEILETLLVTDHYLPTFFGGSVRVVLELSRRLAARGHVVHLATMNDDLDLPEEEWLDGVHLIRFPVNWQGLRVYPSAIIHGFRCFRDLSSRYPLDLIHFHLPFSALGMLAARKSKAFPRLFTFYGPASEELLTELSGKQLAGVQSVFYKGIYLKVLRALWRHLQGAMLSACDRVVVLSEYSRGQILDLPHAPSSADITLVPGGADVVKFRPAIERKEEIRKRLGLPEDQMVLLTVRRLVPRMGLENLIRAMPTVLQSTPDAHLVIGGKGVLLERLRSLASELNVAHKVTFTGFIPEETLPAYYQAADLFVLPTVALEGFGLPVVEAMACGLPVIATPVGAPVEILSQFDPGLIAADASPQGLADAILAFVTHKVQDPGLPERCRAFVEAGHSWERVVDQYEELYFEVVAARQAKRESV